MILIATPAYGCMLHMDYHQTILELHHNGLKSEQMTIGNDSLITRPRNKAASYCLHANKFTHLVFIDADVKIEAISIYKLITSGKDLIGASVALKGFTEEGKPVLNHSDELSKDGNLIEVSRFGSAVMCISIKLLKDLAAISDTYEIDCKFTRGVKLPFIHYDIFKVGVYDGEYLSEDYYFCKKAKELGYKAWIDTSIKTIHNGNWGFSNFV
jgi:hypothetical protein